MKKILLITNFKPGTGISVQVQLLADRLKREEYIAEIFSTKGSFFYRLFVFFKLLIAGKKFDVFHIHACSGYGFFPIVVGLTCGKLLRKKIIITYHGGGAEDFFEKHRSFVAYFLNRADKNIVLSGFLGKIFDKYSIPYIIIPNFVELSDEFFIKRDLIQPNYISLRSLYKLYNIDCILRAFKIVKDKYPNAKLKILAEGPEKQNLINLSEELQLSDVDFVGKVDNDKIYSYLNNSDIFVSASTVDNQPVSILEAFNAGLLVIAGNVGGVPYMVEDKHTAYLFKVGDSVELAEKMIVAVENQDVSKQMIANAKSDVEKYAWENVKSKLLNLYD